MDNSALPNQNPIPTAVPQSLPPPLTNQPVAKSSSPTMWDAFEHILMFISLYVLATAIVLILNFFIDKWFPGVNVQSYSYGNSFNDFQVTLLRGYLASLIVSYPLFSFFFLSTTKRTMQNPALRNLKARKSLIYFTLVITFIIMLINVISLVFKLLSGDVTTNFVLHLIALSLVSGFIFVYYLFQVREDRKINV